MRRLPFAPRGLYKAGNIFSAFVKKYDISVYNEETHSGLLRHFYMRYGAQTGEIMVGIVINGNLLPKHAELVEDLKTALG